MGADVFGTGQWNHNRFRVWGRRNDTGLGLPFPGHGGTGRRDMRFFLEGVSPKPPVPPQSCNERAAHFFPLFTG